MRSVSLLVLAAACTPVPTYRVQRAARVPRPTVPLRTGQPLAGPVELTLGASSVAHTMRPRAGNEMKALEIPDHQVRGELRIRLFERGELAVIHERAIGRATKIDETQADTDSGQPWGVGVAFRGSIAPGGPWSVGLDFEVMRWSIPYAEERVCISECDGVPTYQSLRSTSGEATWGVGITPAYRFGDVTLFGGGFLRNHPTIVRKGTEYSEYNDEDTEAGPINVLLHAGAAVHMGAFTAMLLVHQNLDRDPVVYGPGIGFALSASFDPASGGTITDPDEKLAQTRARMRRSQARRDAR
ncbi:MAG: hypothetical protein M4D80_08480 [Myxococcota bacterium]|nr:hypothetical protein [Deltaproteobacteria bacterium]MDQ3335184.1 hypothetical protein [Myxococcota bacterium]